MPKNKAKKVGRPTLPKGKAKDIITPVRMKPIERAQFERAAKKAGLSLSGWIRQTLEDAMSK